MIVPSTAKPSSVPSSYAVSDTPAAAPGTVTRNRGDDYVVGDRLGHPEADRQEDRAEHQRTER